MFNKQREIKAMAPTQLVYDVLGVGISAVDDTLTVESYPQSGAKVAVQSSARHGGGLACTAIAAAAVLGGKTAFVARFGTDDLSDYIRSNLLQRGVDVSHIISDALSQPYHSRIIIDRSTGERTIFYDLSRYKPVQAADVSDELLASARVLLVDFLNAPGPLELILKARRANVPVILDIEGQSTESAALLEYVDHLVVPEEFARWASGRQDLQAACAALARIPRAATVVTAGAAGCWWTDSPQRAPVHLPAFAVKAVNTNGCGDTFHGAYALAIAKSCSIMEAVCFATASAAIKAAGSAGGWDALPTSAQVADLLRQRFATDDSLAGLFTQI
ncbi:MAG: PfkB family carbohydrate kinase [Burkholderiales bacterium]